MLFWIASEQNIEDFPHVAPSVDLDRHARGHLQALPERPARQ
jgi:hypothetical protein